MRTTLFLLALAVAIPAHAQVDPVTTAQGQILSATARGYAERDAARLRRGVPPKTAAERKQEADCAQLWKLRERMTRSERVRLYDLCPR
ncbi:hypothetical protein ACFQ15_11855 [Sphingomonas hankookensis]|uniref:hypothetical protein n=1 Tax=Sphingomonas hankookensis TaxID=563996 RepID=UPI001F55EFD5|nr:hypothetical protein [Sphingomonas hankookensis]